MVKIARSTLAADKDYLSDKHARIDERVAELGSRRVLTTIESTELRRLKKLKLHAKDRLSSVGGAGD